MKKPAMQATPATETRVETPAETISLVSIKAQAGAEVPAPRTDGRQTYAVRPGVAWVNGRKLRGAKTVDLTEAEARYDLAEERIALAGSEAAKAWSADAAPSADAGLAAEASQG